MPNWCETSVSITGENEELKRFADTIGPKFDFDRVIPMPGELHGTVADGHTEYQVYYGNGLPSRNQEEHRAELDEDPKNRERADRDKSLVDKYGAYDWYEWCWENWGTKWPADSVRLQTSGDAITIDFMTAWAFPEPIFQKLSEMFPSLHFCGQAVEHGMAWAIRFEAENGELFIAELDYDDSYPDEDDELDEDGDVVLTTEDVEPG